MIRKFIYSLWSPIKVKWWKKWWRKRKRRRRSLDDEKMLWCNERAALLYWARCCCVCRRTEKVESCVPVSLNRAQFGTGSATVHLLSLHSPPTALEPSTHLKSTCLVTSSSKFVYNNNNFNYLNIYYWISKLVSQKFILIIILLLPLVFLNIP